MLPPLLSSLSRWCSFAAILSLVAFAQPVHAAQRTLQLERTGGYFPKVLQVLTAPDDSGRLFVLQREGLVRIIDATGSTLPTPYMDLTAQTIATVEQGLLSIAFHPDYAQNGWVYVHYTNLNGNTRVDRFIVDANDANQVDPASQVEVLQIQQPKAWHNGGTIAFGPDGYLYLGFGDGGGPNTTSQDGQTLLGKILRLDVSVQPYQIPSTNPFVGNAAVLDEIWAMGVRNPWQFSFDQETGDLWIADVGDTTWEEVNFEAAGSPGGLNYGWPTMEGPDCHVSQAGCNQTGLELPFYSYAYGGSPFKCAISGGVVYRGEAMATMRGRYFYSDFCSGQVWSMRRDAGGQAVDIVDHSLEFGVLGSVVSFGVDDEGEVYVVGMNGRINKLVPAGLNLAVGNAVASSTVPIAVTAGVANKRAFVIYSGDGLGQTVVPELGVVLDLLNPTLHVARSMDSSGNLSLTVHLPPSLSGIRMWVQAAQVGVVSNVITQVIE
jgi:glucose/arabinose dehydrogenase